MDENIESVNTQEVAEPETLEPENVETPEVVEPETQEVEEPIGEGRDLERDYAFASMRRQNEKLMNTLAQMGFDGKTPEEVIDKATAYQTGKTVDEIQIERKKQEEIESIKSENEVLKSEAINRMMEDDLKKIQAINPEIKSLKDLGSEYFNLISTGKVDSVTAYHAVMAQKERETKTPPQPIGKLNQTKTADKEFFTSEELDKLTSEDLDNPVIYAKAMKSLAQIK